MAANDNNVEITLRRLADSGLNIREALVLFAIIKRPGIAGADIAEALGLNSRSKIQYVVERLEKRELIENRQKERRQGIPAIFHATQKGRLVWAEIEGQNYDFPEGEEESHW